MQSNDLLTPLPKMSITSVIAERITNYIMESGLSAGDRLPPERDLMQRLSIGRSTLREAIATLKSLGIVEVRLGSGMFVGKGDTTALTEPLSWSALMSEGTINEVLEARIIIETELAALAAARATEAQIDTIQKCLQQLQRASKAESTTARDELNFHMAIAETAGNMLLYRMMNTLQRMHRAMAAKANGKEHPNGDDIKELNEELPEVFEAIRSHNPDKAREAMRKHLESVKSRLVSSISE